MSEYYGCGNSCIFGPPPGMGTNGGCGCLRDLPMSERIRISKAIRQLKEKNKALQKSHDTAERIVSNQCDKIKRLIEENNKLKTDIEKLSKK